MSRTKSLYIARGMTGALVIAAGCSSPSPSGTSNTDVAYEDAYVYDYTYLAELAFSGFYWTSSWGYPALAFDITTNDGGISDLDGGETNVDDAASPTTTPRGAVGQAIRSLARGEAVCPGHVTITERSANPPCTAAGVSSVRAGVTLVFDQCQITGGGTLNGTIDVRATSTASETTCSANTTITLGFRATLVNLSYTDTDGAKLVIPNQMYAGTNEFKYGQNPASIVIDSSGQFQIYDRNGGLVSDRSSIGRRTFTFAGSRTGYEVDGTVTLTDNVDSEITATLTAARLLRSSECCRPTGGTLTVTRVGGRFSGAHTWTFGPACGSARFDGNDVTLPACY